MTPAFDIACLGRAAVDLYGEQVGCALEDVSTFARYLGGSPANTAVGAARLGLRSAMIARVGDEQNGRFVRETLAREGVDTSQVSTDPRRLTALVFLAVRDRDEFPHIFYRDNCADMGLQSRDINARFLARCGALLVSGTHLSRPPTFRACMRAARLARAAKARVVLDIDYRPVLWGRARHAEGHRRDNASKAATGRIRSLLPRCDLVVGTEDEFRVAGGCANLIAALRAVRARTTALLVLKLGPRGCVAFAGAIPPRLQSGLAVPGFPVEVFNVLGAGDAFMAGFLHGWLRREPVAQCCRYANACGAIVVSRHGCSPAMPTLPELRHFLEHGPASARLREDAALEHIHRATTRPKQPEPLFILAFDHRSQLEALATSHGAGAGDIETFKGLLATAFRRVARKHAGAGVILDDRYGDSILPRLTSRGHWIARPVEVPGSMPLSFEAGDNVGLAMRAWPAEHTAKCLVLFHPDQPRALRAAQIARVAALARACEATGRDLLLEVIAPAGSRLDSGTTARSMQAFYRAGVRPAWWKLPPNDTADAWLAIGKAIERHDPLCRGVLVLGMEAPAEKLLESFVAAARSPCVRGFAVGRSIFGEAAQRWFAREWDDRKVVRDIVARYEEVIALWQHARKGERA